MSPYNSRSLSLVLSSGNLYPVDAAAPEATLLLPASSFDTLIVAAYLEAYVL